MTANEGIQTGQRQSISESRGVFGKRRKFALATRHTAKIEVADRPTSAKAKRPMLEPYPEAERKDFRFLCNACGKRLKAPESVIGKKVECPHCGSTISVPSPSADPLTGREQERWIQYEKPKTIKFFCIRCGQSLEADRLMAKIRFACPRCMHAMIVPLLADE